VTGVLRPTAGRSSSRARTSPAAAAPDSKKAIARSYQITNILPGATVLENVRIAVQSRHHAWSLLRHYRSYTDVIDRARAVLEAVGLREDEEEVAANLSHGASATSRSASRWRQNQNSSASTNPPQG